MAVQSSPDDGRTAVHPGPSSAALADGRTVRYTLPASARQRRSRLPLIGAAVVAAAIGAGGVAAVLLTHRGGPAGGCELACGTRPAAVRVAPFTQTYSDPSGTFSFSYPAQWAAPTSAQGTTQIQTVTGSLYVEVDTSGGDPGGDVQSFISTVGSQATDAAVVETEFVLHGARLGSTAGAGEGLLYDASGGQQTAVSGVAVRHGSATYVVAFVGLDDFKLNPHGDQLVEGAVVDRVLDTWQWSGGGS